MALSRDSLVTEIFKVSDDIKNNRTIENILTHLTTEVGELAEEVQIELGHCRKERGEDGVVGEAIDVILCAIDIIRVHDPFLSEETLLEMMDSKISKWRRNHGEYNTRE